MDSSTAADGADEATRQVNEDALAYIREHPSMGDPPVPPGNLKSNVYKLLIKNVSRNDPLTEDEAQVGPAVSQAAAAAVETGRYTNVLPPFPPGVACVPCTDNR
jgi:hypothetical protein